MVYNTILNKINMLSLRHLDICVRYICIYKNVSSVHYFIREVYCLRKPDTICWNSSRVIHLSATYNLQQTTISNCAALSKITNKAWYIMRIVCWQTILMKYHTLFFFRKLGKDVAKFVVCCSCDWRLKLKQYLLGRALHTLPGIKHIR